MTHQTHYERQMIEELQDLSEEEQAQMLQLIRFLKEELGIFPGSTTISFPSSVPDEEEKAAILRHAGLLANLTAEEEQRFAEATARRPLFGNRSVHL